PESRAPRRKAGARLGDGEWKRAGNAADRAVDARHYSKKDRYLPVPAAAGRLHGEESGELDLQRTKQSQARDPLPEPGKLPAVPPARICRLPDVQPADPRKLPR